MTLKNALHKLRSWIRSNITQTRREMENNFITDTEFPKVLFVVHVQGGAQNDTKQHSGFPSHLNTLND